MNPLVGALVLILLGLLGARLSFAEARVPLGPRLLISSGTHFLFLGFLLGSHALALFPREVIDQLYPFLALGLGWIGFLFGLQLDRRHLRWFPRRYLAIALLQAALTFLLFLGFGLLALGTEIGLEHRVGLLTAAATACISTPAAIALISRTFRMKGRVSRLLYFIASLDAIVGILALQLTYAFHRGPVLASAFDATVGLEWISIAALLGVIFGVLFLWLTRPRPSGEEIVLFLLGLVVFASGTALHLGLSPLFVSAVAGAVVANLSPLRHDVYALLQTWEQPVYVILLILAGALLDFPTWLVIPLALGYLVVRALAKIVAGYAAVRIIRPAFTPPADLGAGLIPQGGISLAMAVGIALTYGAAELDGLVWPDLVFTTIVLGVIASELVGPVLTRGLLRRTGEIHPRVERGRADAEISREASGRTPATSNRREP